MTKFEERITQTVDQTHAVADLADKGWALLAPQNLPTEAFADIDRLHGALEHEVDEDPSPGRRWRAYRALTLSDAGCRPAAPTTYRQSSAFNWTDGDKDRRFAALSDAVVMSATVQALIATNAEIARKVTPEIFRQPVVQIGLHLISYRPKGQTASYSSPIWLHRDEERYVAVHLIGVSPDLRGGDNVIEPAHGGEVEMFALRAPLEALLLTQKVRHAVTPSYARGAGPVSRDVLLITFN